MWTFRKRDRAGVEQGITQRNDFNNEDKELSENLIRETIQNSLDARDGKANHVEVKFSLLKHSSDSKTYLKTLMKDAAQHIKASKIEIPNKPKTHNTTNNIKNIIKYFWIWFTFITNFYIYIVRKPCCNPQDP